MCVMAAVQRAWGKQVVRIGVALAVLAAVGAAGEARSQTLQPGLWESTARATKVEVPGAPGLGTQVMKQTNAQMKPIRQCLTAAQIKQDPARLFGQNGCTTSRSRFAGGVRDIAATCQGGAQLTVTGRYTPTTSTAKARIVTGAGGQQMVVESESQGRRVGNC